MSKKARMGSLQHATDVRPHFCHFAEPGVDLEDVLDAEYWALAAADVRGRPWALIDVISRDGTWEAVLRLTSLSDDGSQTMGRHVGVNLRLISSWHAKKAKLVEISEGYTVEFAYEKWKVFRGIHPSAHFGDFQTEAKAR